MWGNFLKKFPSRDFPRGTFWKKSPAPLKNLLERDCWEDGESPCAILQWLPIAFWCRYPKRSMGEDAKQDHCSTGAAFCRSLQMEFRRGNPSPTGDVI